MTTVRPVLLVLLLIGLSACADPLSEALQGTVTSENGPEAGVWVIAETNDLPTPYNKIVVTNDEGRYLIPELPEATYQVWVRGYGLVDSPKTEATPGATLDLTATVAPDAQAAAAIYPSGYWLSMMNVPERDQFPGTEANGLNPGWQNQAQFLWQLKSGNCMACHGLGSPGTRTMPEMFADMDSKAAWERRLMSGQAGGSMTGSVNFFGKEPILEMFADWTDRIAAGEIPPSAPERPQGVERNVVITQWDWADPKAYLHDVVSTDRRDPTLHADGKLYGALEASADYLPVLDPVTHEATQVPLTVRDPSTPPASGPEMPAPSPYWGDEPIWNSKNNVHNPMFDHLGRMWITSAVRPRENPDFCKEGSDHPSAIAFPVERAGRHLQVYDPATEELTHISTCFSTHHLMFAMDDNHTLWTSGGGNVVGWLDVKMFDETDDEEASQGWSPMILDTNGNGQRDEWVDVNEPVDPTKDKRIRAGFYSVAPAPDGSIWATSLGYPGGIVRIEPGNDPTHTALAEYYQPPLDEDGHPIEGWSPRGGDVDKNGVMWVAMASGHLARFDRTACEGPLNGPEATGQHCPEGWTFYTEPLPQMNGVEYSGSAESSYYTWVDWFDTSGFGENTPINTGNSAEGLLVWDDGEWVILRVPYPLGFYTKWLDGRIDDPNAGWKGKGLWATISTRAPWHMETGAGTTSKVYKFQMRPDPLAY